MNNGHQKYIDLAFKLKAENALIVPAEQIYMDPRTVLKCRWGCDLLTGQENIRCGMRQTTFAQREAALARYKHALILHGRNVQRLTVIGLAVERAAFIDGNYWATLIQCCNLCSDCQVKLGLDCRHPTKIRPCEARFGIDVYKTAREAGLPIEPLKNRDETPNRYAFVLLD